MKKMNPVFRLLFTAGISTLLFSCGGEKKEAATDETSKPADTTASMQMAPTPPPAAFVPFDIMEVKHSVKDYATWRPGFNADSVNRKAAGLKDLAVGAEMDHPNNLIIAMEMSDAQKAKDFAASPKLKETMGKLGVISKPEANYFHVIRFNAESKEKKWVVVTHKVKDFDAWVKVYDGEGTAKRLGEGMVDVLLARGIDDPNMVELVFDITDMDKAKAAITSEEKKKLMMSAGVEGVPTIKFYNTVE